MLLMENFPEGYLVTVHKIKKIIWTVFYFCVKGTHHEGYVAIYRLKLILDLRTEVIFCLFYRTLPSNPLS